VGWGSRVRSGEAAWTAPALAELPAADADGIISRLLLEAVSGGQPLLLTRRGRPAAVLCDPDTWAELEELAGESLEASA
jgi:prevent-host-death family protein